MDLYGIQMLGKSDSHWATLTWKKTYNQAKSLLNKYESAWTDYKLRIVHYHKEILLLTKEKARHCKKCKCPKCHCTPVNRNSLN